VAVLDQVGQEEQLHPCDRAGVPQPDKSQPVAMSGAD